MPADRDAQSSAQRPTLALLELLGRRWSLRILWELRDAPLTFGELKTRCDEMSASVLTQRLNDLRDAALIEAAEDGGYRLTAHGTTLLGQLSFVDEWASEWAGVWGGARLRR
jgi:DNA-binding HxlR family transcriptional regulator